MTTDDTSSSARSPLFPREDRRFFFDIALLAITLSSVPTVVGLALARGRVFLGVPANIADYGVYMAWMRQGADGHFIAPSLYAPGANPVIVNPYYALLGLIAPHSFTGRVVVFQLARVVADGLLLAAIWTLINYVIADRRSARLALLFVAFSAGLGWVYPAMDWANSAHFPVDVWQAESTTFLSMEAPPHIPMSECLQVSAITALLIAATRNNMRYAIVAGLAGMALGLFHTYDILSTGAVWLAFVTVIVVREPKRLLPFAKATAIAVLLTLLGTVPIAYELMTNVAFKSRADSLTQSGSLIQVAVGYGLTLLFALVAITGGAIRMRRKAPLVLTMEGYTLLAVWMLVNVGVSYIPVAFQRKLIQGSHVPIAILASVGFCYLVSFVQTKIPRFPFWPIAIPFVACLFFTPMKLMLLDIPKLAKGIEGPTIEQYYIAKSEYDAMEWVDRSAAPGSIVQAIPWLALGADGNVAPCNITLATMTPGFTGHPVYFGHWAETPGFIGKLGQTMFIALAEQSDVDRAEAIRQTGIVYILVNTSPEAGITTLPTVFSKLRILPRNFKLVYENRGERVYQVVPVNR